ncbi:hypothetical protein U1Q18_015208 [Sarracenia purpurea var. burkii]
MEEQGSRSEIELVIETPSIATTQDHQRASVTQHHHHHHHHRRLSITIAERSLSSILTRLHAGYFRICISLGGQALLWKTLAEQSNDSSSLLHVLRHVFHSPAIMVLWSFALFTLGVLSVLYILRCFFRFSMVKAEFSHHVGVNYLFAPWISCLLLLQSAPFSSPNNVSYLVLWWVFAVPVVALDVKVYGQWFTKGKQFLTAVANPTSQLSVIGNLVGARAAAQMGRQEIARSASGDATAGFLLVLRGTEHGELGLGLNIWKVRYCFEDAILSLALPFHVTGNVSD